MSIRVFLSTVSDEFRLYRDQLRDDLTRHNVEVKVQEDFKDLGDSTLDKLDTYIANCDAVVHLIGDMCGSVPGAREQAALLRKHPLLEQEFPPLAEAMRAGQDISYTQWEAWLALYHGKLLLTAKAEPTAPRAPKYEPTAESRAAQSAHLARLEMVRRYPGCAFANAADLAKHIAYTAILDLLVKDHASKVPDGHGISAIVDSNSRKWHGLVLETGRAEPAIERIQIRPSELLLARYRIAPFIDSGGILSSIFSWVTQLSERRATGRLYVAPGGFGKTRLAIELVSRLESVGWRCGFLPRTHGANVAPGAFSDLVADADCAGVCVVADYAESKISVMRQLAAAASTAAPDGPPIRIIAFARSTEGWWDSFAGDPSPSAIFDPIPFGAVGDQLSAEDRSALFLQARAAFVDKFRELRLPYRDQGRSPDITGADRPLIVIANAFVDAIGIDLRGRSVLQTLYEEERRHWQRVLDVDADDEVGDLARAVAQVTLVQGSTLAGATELIRADDADRSIPRPKSLMALRRLYGVRAIQNDPKSYESEEIPFVNPIEPDLLGEHVCIAVLEECGVSLLLATLRTALSGPPLFKDDAARVLTVLARATHPSHDPRIRRGAERAIAGIAVLISELTPSQVGYLSNSMPPLSTALSTIALHAARRLAEVAPQDDSEAALKQRADTQSLLSARLSEQGYDEEALAASEEAVRLHRELVAINRKGNLPRLASALHLLSMALVKVGRRKEAVTHSQEAVQLNRELAGMSTETLGPGLAETLANLGNTYSEVGRKDEALKALKESCTQFELLSKDDPDRFLSALARALASLGNRLFESGLPKEALEATSKAHEIERTLVSKNRDAYLPGLAATLNNLCRALHAQNRVDEALAAIAEALSYHRELVAKNRGGHLLGLALALQGSSVVHFDIGQTEQGLNDITEAIALLGELSAKRPDPVIPELVRTIANLGRMLVLLDRLDLARNVLADALRLLQPIAVKYRESHRELFMQIRNQYMLVLKELANQESPASHISVEGKINNAIREGSATFDEADRLFESFSRAVAIMTNLDSDDEAENINHIHAVEKTYGELAAYLKNNAGDDTLAPIDAASTFLMTVVTFGTGEASKAASIELSRLYLNVKRVRVRAHPENENARRDLAETLLSSADEPVYGAAFLQELYDLQKTHPEDSVIREFAAAARHVEINNAVTNKEIARRHASFQELRTLAAGSPDNNSVRLALVKALYAVGVAGLLNGEPERAFLEEVISIIRANPGDKALQDFFTSHFKLGS